MPPADDRPTASLNGHAPDPTGTPPPGSTADLPPQPPTATDGDLATFEAWMTGVVAGRYRRVEKHGCGGLGEVLRAEDTVLGRDVALKRLRRDRHTPALRDRFLREARVTGRLEHPNIVPVYDLVESDDPVYAMRFLPGDTLADAVRAYHQRRAAGAAGPLELPRLLGAFVLVCEAVAYAHSRGVLHRDLKGANILFGRFGEVCLADWGLAKRTDAPDQPGDPHPLDPPLDGATADGAVVGTPAFMAPELALGERATEASDVYALGAVLYQVLTDQPPHTGSHKEVLSKLETGAAVSPARQLVPSVHPALDAVCRKALSRDPAARYPSATAVADEVRAYLAGEPVAAYPEPWAARAARWVRRHKAGVLAGVVGLAVFAMVASGAAVLLWQANEATRRERDEKAALAAVLLDYSTALADAVNLSEAGPMAGRQAIAARKARAERAVAATERLLVALPDDQAQQAQLAKLLWNTANLARLTNDQRLAARSYAAAVTIQRGLVDRAPADGRPRRLLAHMLLDEATLHYLFGRPAEAAAGADRATDELDQLPPGDQGDPTTRRARGLAHTRRAESLTRLGRFAEAERTANQAADLFAGLADVAPAARHSHDPLFHAEALLALAEARRAANPTAPNADARQAEDLAVAALRTATSPDTHPDLRHSLYRCLVVRGRNRQEAGEPTEGFQAELNQAVTGWRELTERDPAVAHWRLGLATGLTARGRLPAVADPAAADDLRVATRLLTRLTEDAPDRPDYWSALADAWVGLTRVLPPGPERADAWRHTSEAVERAAAAAATDALVLRARNRLAAEIGNGP